MSTALIVLTEGFEEIEAISPIDLLRRAGVEVTVASREDRLTVTGRSQLAVQAEVALAELAGRFFDLLVLPGGPGTAALRRDPRVLDLARQHAAAGRWVAAICAAPTVLRDAGLLDGRRVTAHHSVAAEFPQGLAADPVVIDGRIITSRGAGTALHFGLACVEALAGEETARRIAASVHFSCSPS